MKTGGERVIRWAAICICTVTGVAACYLALRYLLPAILPFAIALGIAAGVTPPARRIARRFGISERLCAALLLTVVLALTAWAIWAGIVRGTRELHALLDRMMTRYGSLDGMLSTWMDALGEALASAGLAKKDDPALRERLYGILSSVLSALSTKLPIWAGRVLSALPSILFASVVAVVAAFYFCIDREAIGQGICGILPAGIRARLPQWRARMRRLSLRYVRCYLLLMLITFLLLMVGFLLLGVPYAFLTALTAAIVDMLPVLGVGTVLLPWAAILLLQKSYYRGFGLLILYAVCILVRQLAEPKLLGKSIGLGALPALVATYVGFSLFGIVGMLLAPLVAALFKSILSGLRPTDAKND